MVIKDVLGNQLSVGDKVSYGDDDNRFSIGEIVSLEVDNNSLPYIKVSLGTELLHVDGEIIENIDPYFCAKVVVPYE